MKVLHEGKHNGRLLSFFSLERGDVDLAAVLLRAVVNLQARPRPPVPTPRLFHPPGSFGTLPPPFLLPPPCGQPRQHQQQSQTQPRPPARPLRPAAARLASPQAYHAFASIAQTGDPFAQQQLRQFLTLAGRSARDIFSLSAPTPDVAYGKLVASGRRASMRPNAQKIGDLGRDTRRRASQTVESLDPALADQIGESAAASALRSRLQRSLARALKLAVVWGRVDVAKASCRRTPPPLVSAAHLPSARAPRTFSTCSAACARRTPRAPARRRRARRSSAYLLIERRARPVTTYRGSNLARPP